MIASLFWDLARSPNPAHWPVQGQRDKAAFSTAPLPIVAKVSALDTLAGLSRTLAPNPFLVAQDRAGFAQDAKHALGVRHRQRTHATRRRYQ